MTQTATELKFKQTNKFMQCFFPPKMMGFCHFLRDFIFGLKPLKKSLCSVTTVRVGLEIFMEKRY